MIHTIEERQLKNGARGLFIHTPGATVVYYSFQFRAGTLYVEDQAKSQAAHIMEHLAFGTNKFYASQKEFNAEFDKNGAYHNALTSNTNMVYYSKAALMEWQRILDLHLKAISTPVYTEASLEREKNNVKEELVGNKTNNWRILWQEAMRQAGASQWFDPIELATIPAVTLADVNRHFETTHTTENLRFIVVGDLESHMETIVSALEAIELPNGKRLPEIVKPATGSGVRYIHNEHIDNLMFHLGFFINRRINYEERTALGILRRVLTGGFQSRILGTARDLGICYGIRMETDWFSTQTTELSFEAQVGNNHAQELFELIIRELSDIRSNGISEEELSAAKEYALGTVQMKNQTVTELAGWYEGEYYNEDVIDRVEDTIDRIKSVSNETIMRVLDELLGTRHLVLAAITNDTQEAVDALYQMVEQNFHKA